MNEPRGVVRVELGSKRVRAYFGGRCVVDTIAPRLVWEGRSFPAYYLPEEDVAAGVLRATAKVSHSPSRGDAHYFDLVVEGRTASDAAWTYPESPLDEIRGLVRFDWHALDAWFEEDEEVFVHPRDPYTRVDVLDSSRHVQVIVNGLTVADSHSPKILFETRLPPRYYLPKTDVRMDLLTPTDSSTMCPYKGTARYWSVEAGGETLPDLAWSYPSPFAESQKVAGLVCFYNERVDIVIDGVPQERPRTPFS